MAGPPKVLVIGTSGFFGGWISRELQEAGFEVRGASRSSGKLRCDLLDPGSLEKLLAAERPDVVVNAAGITSPATAQTDPGTCFKVNTGGALNLLEAVRTTAPRSRVIALSSATVYTGRPPFHENSPTSGDSPYSASKLAMELLCQQYANAPGLAVTVVRCFNLTGPGEPPGQVTSELVRAALATRAGGQAEVRVGEPSTARDFTDVRDGARAIRLMVETELTGKFNLCSGRATNLTELAETISGHTGVELVLNGSGTGRATSGLLSIHGDGTKLKQATGWHPEISLEKSLADLVAAHR